MRCTLCAGPAVKRDTDYCGGCEDDDDLVYNYSVNIGGYNFAEPRFYFSRMHMVKPSAHRTLEENRKIKEAGKRRLYVSRSDAKARRILNEEEVIKFVKSYNFEVINPGDFTFIEQISIFSNARLLIIQQEML